MQNSIKYSSVLLVVFIITAFIFFRPIPIPSDESECLTVSGIVLNIFEGGEKDVCFKLMNSSHVYYINRGLENGLDLEVLRKKLVGHDIQIKYPDYFSWFGTNHRSIHASIVRFGQEEIFNEINQ